MDNTEIKIQSLNQYIDALHNSVQKGSYCYRGHVNQTWQAIPTLLRRTRIEAIYLQSSLFRELLSSPGNLPFLRNQDPIEYLMLLQHFGVPTKLLDVTLDPLIALFFACHDSCREHENVDVKVYMFPLEQYNKVKINTPELDVYKRGITLDNYQALLIERIEINEHLYFEPLIKNPRMRMQDGAFFMFSTCPLENSDKCLSMEEFHGALNKYRRSQNNENLLWYAHRIIDKDYKIAILKELDFQFGINESMLYVESNLMNSVESFYKELHKKVNT